MPGFASMSERHAFGLEALAEMTGKLLQAAYARASHPVDPEDQDRAILLFDRLARGFRLTLAMESRLDRDRHRAAVEADAPATRLPSRSEDCPPRASREEDRERDADLEPSDLPGHVRELRRVVADGADILDPDCVHADTLDRWEGAWGDVLYVKPDPAGSSHAPPEAVAPPPTIRPLRRALRRASG